MAPNPFIYAHSNSDCKKMEQGAAKNNSIRESIASVLCKDIRKKLAKINPYQTIVWQFHLHQSIVFQSAILSYKSSSVATLDEKISATKLLIAINNQSKITYEKAS